MAQTSGSGGIGSLAMGGIAAVAVILGGVVLMQFAGGDQKDPSADRALREGTNTDAVISPSAENPVIVSSTQVGQEAAPGAVAESDAVENATPDTGSAPQGAEADLGPGQPDAAVVENAVETGEDAEPAPPEAQADPAAAPERSVGHQDTAVAGVPAAPAPVASGAEGNAESALSGEGTAALAAPQLDLVRVDPEGAVVIAGRAQDGALVQVLIDGVVLEQTVVQGGGEFAVFSSIIPSDSPRVISLLARADGHEAASVDQFIIAPAAPMPAPQVADAGVPQPEAPAAQQLAQTSTEETSEVVAKEVKTVKETALPEADAPESNADTAEAQTPAPPVTAQVGAPDQPDEGGSKELPVLTAEADASTPGPQETTVPQSQPVASETPASAETAPAPRPETTAVAVLRAGADGVELVQPAAPVLNGKVALDTISYSDSGAVLLAGRGRPEAVVRAYVNNQIKAELPVAEDGRWGGALGEVEPGIYTLRLDEVDPASGAVLSRLETPFKREAPEVLQPPVQEPGVAPSQPVPLVRAVTVQKGDTLWAISQERYGSGFLYVRVFEANQDAIRDPDLIYPGQVFNLPE
ncbi:LysM peptidoglycan-binding domain-containing protein [Phycobacter sp. K97]|uniref:LysM peptidoglycan-binding domain-containing protein n=1 Tax=Phycobacter sedimenti TaxID=3133977 RepID=UPI00311EF96C